MTEGATYDRIAATLAFDASVGKVSQVSTARVRALAKLDIFTIRDLLSNYPHRYTDMTRICTIADARIGSFCTIKARVHETKVKRPRPRLKLAEITLVDDTGTLIVTMFGQPWMAERLKPGTVLAVAGKIEFNYGFKRLINPDIEELAGWDADFSGMIKPTHPATSAVQAGLMRRLIANALDETRGTLDPLPLSLRAKYRLMSRGAAIRCIHFPTSMEERDEARRRLAYEELLLLELMLLQEGGKRAKGRTPQAHRIDGPLRSALESAFPFALTDDQMKARDEILARMAQERAANHMLLGDVGTGKTAVAAIVLAAVADTGTQALFMAPTELLARQHAETLGALFDAVGISWDILTGATSSRDRAGIIERVRDGKTTVLIGTHALLEDDIEPAACTLVIIDEQQRFGVEQRSALLAKGECPDVLYLTATPIPRTLALALFGSLSLSYLHQRPYGTPPRKTFLHTYDRRGVAYDAAKEALARGEQVYVICPLVAERAADKGDGKSAGSDGSGKSGGEGKDDGPSEEYVFADMIEDASDMMRDNTAAAESEAAFLQTKVFVDYRVGLVHGKLSDDEKHRVMDEFRDGEIQVLVATTVIEVGVDVPRATVMIIEDADRFGLAQLHQLRGRVGRGELPGEVHLISNTRKEVALTRLAAMEKTDDGFELANYDLSMRREGDILGNRQHGASLLKLVNIVRDGAIVEAAHADALAILEEDPDLATDLYHPLAREARIVYGKAEG